MSVVDRNFMTDGTGQAIAESLNAVAEAIEQGGGGGSTSEPLIVTATITNPETKSITADKTLSDIQEAVKAGKNVYVYISNSSVIGIQIDLLSLTAGVGNPASNSGASAYYFNGSYINAMGSQGREINIQLMVNSTGWSLIVGYFDVTVY